MHFLGGEIKDLVDCCCMMLLDALVFLSTLLLDAEETKRPEKNNTHFGGGLENGQEVGPPFLAQESFFQILKNPYSFSVSQKMGGGHFFSKRPMLQGGHILREKKLKLFGVF